jgi:hypothetical protein
MGMSRWLQRQSRRRLFFIFWSGYLVTYAVPLIGVTSAFAADHPGRPFPTPPLWVFGLDGLGSACLAADAIRRRSKRIRSAQTCQADHPA